MTTTTGAGDVSVPDTLGWLLALRAAARLDRATHVRVTGHVASPRGWDLDTRRRVASAARHGAPAVVDGEAVRERLAERRWLAWFPRPVGPRHAVNVGGASVGRLARLPQVQLVRAHVTASSLGAELLQAMANVAGWTMVDGVVERWIARVRDLDDAEVRWACVVEVTEDDEALVRAWAHGWAPTATAVALSGALADNPRGFDPHVDPGGDAARHVLDHLAAETGLRWSLTGPAAS